MRWTLVAAGRFLKRRFVESVWRDPGELTTKLDTLGRPMHWPLIIGSTTIRCAHTSCAASIATACCSGDRMEDCPAAKVDYSWLADQFGKGLEIIQVTGDHYTMMREHPHDQNLARE